MSSPGNPSIGSEGAPRKRGPGRPKGSRNWKTLEALANAAAVVPITTAATGARATLRECSASQPKYRVEVYYDGKGE
jgi:hypothetical protein